MSSVDDRIVNMQFNNKQFESGVSTSQKSLEGLEKTLSSTAKSKGLSGMSNGVEAVKNKFSLLQVAGVTAVATIATKAVDAGLRLVKSLAITPIIDGFKEYQTNLESIQTVMANTGKGIKPVNAAMNQLNHYADKTIYNFSQMAHNVGTFTAAGVDLKTSVASIQGISNIAALSGSSAQQASTAMYQLSQAIASGRVGLQDWNSVVNAGMGGKVFQTALATTGQAMGTIEKGALKAGEGVKRISISGQSFRESIMAQPGQTSWLTSDVLTNTLKLMDGRLSKAALAAQGLTKKQIGLRLEQEKGKLAAQGYSKAQIASLLKTADAAFQAATVIKTFPQLLDVVREAIGSSWGKTFSIIFGNFNESKKLWSAVGNTITGAINKASNAFNGFLQQWKNLGGRTALIAGIGNIFKAILPILGAVGKAFRDVFPPASAKSLADATKGFRDFTKSLIPSKSTLKELESIFGGVFALLHTIMQVSGAFRMVIFGLLDGIFSKSGKSSGGILKIAAAVGEALKKFDDFVTMGGSLSKVMFNIGKVGGVALKPIVKGIGLVIEAVAALVSGKGMGEFTTIFDKAKASFMEFVNIVTGGVSTAQTAFSPVTKSVSDLSTKAEGLQKSVSGVAKVFGGFKGGSATKATDTISKSMYKVSTSTGKVTKDVSGLYDTLSGAKATAATATTDGIANSAGSASAGWDRVKTVFKAVGTGIKAVFTGLGNAAQFVKDSFTQLFGNFDALDWATVMNTLLTGGLLLTMRNFVKSLGSIVDAFSGIGDVFEQTTKNLKTMQKEVRAKMIMEIAIAVALLSASLLVLSFINPKKLAVGLGAITTLLADMVGTMYAISKMSGDGSMLKASSSIFIVSAAMILMATAITMLAHQDPKKLAVGIGAIAIALGLMVGTMFAFTKIKGSIEGFAASLLVMALAMNLLALAVLSMGSMDIGTLAKGLGGLAIGLALMVGALFALSLVGPSVMVSAQSILIVSAALVVLAVAVAAFGNMDMGTLAKGFIAMTLGLTLMVAALIILSDAAPTAAASGLAMLSLSGAMVAMAIAIGMLGQLSWSSIAKGLTAIAGAFTILLLAAAAAEVVAPGLIILTVAMDGLGAALALAGLGMLAFGTGFALMAAAGTAGMAILGAAFETFMALLPQFAMQLAAAFVTFLKTMANAAPKIRQSMGIIIRNMLGTVRDAIPQMGKLLQTMISTAIAILKKSVPQWVEMGFTIIDKFLQSAAKHAPSIANSAITLVEKFMDTITARQGELADKAAKMIIGFINAVSAAINNNSGDLAKAGGKLALSIVNGMTGGLLGAGVHLVESAVSELVSHIPKAVRKLLGINSPSKVMIPLGSSVGEGLALGITNSTHHVTRAVDTMMKTVHKHAKQSTKGLVASIINTADQTIAGGNKTVLKAQRTARRQQTHAYAAQDRADILAQRAKDAKTHATKFAKEHPKDKTGKKAANQAANAAQRVADRAQKNANQAKTSSDAAVQHVADVQAFVAADAQGKGDIRSQQAIALADKANKLLTKANTEAAEAKKVTGKARKDLLAQSAKDADAARAAAAASKKDNAQADAFYATSVRKRIKLIQEGRAADAKARKDAETFDKASTQGKADIMSAKAAADQKKADDANKKAVDYIALAKKFAKTDAKKAQHYLDLADTQTQIANQAADDAKQDADSAAQYAQQAAQEAGQSSSSGGTTGTGLTPSRSVLEDAASIVDRYTASLAQAEAAAASATPVVQFVQNNNSPESLSPSEIYRQTKNLISNHEVKMGALN